MGTVTIQEYTTKNPITMIGAEAGVCWGADTSKPRRNYRRGLDCLQNGHGRTFEYPDVYMVLDGYSARVIREWYTHIGGLPTRLQASTRYIDYEHGFDYVTPPSILQNAEASRIYIHLMEEIASSLGKLDALGIPREDTALGLPLGMTTRIVCKHNLRNLMDMSRQRMCSRAYHEYRRLFSDVCAALSNYSEEWAYLAKHYFFPKCELLGYCPEKDSCGRKPRRDASDGRKESERRRPSELQRVQPYTGSADSEAVADLIKDFKFDPSRQAKVQRDDFVKLPTQEGKESE